MSRNRAVWNRVSGGDPRVGLRLHGCDFAVAVRRFLEGYMSNSFDWRLLGKADYAQAAALIASLPSDIRSEMKGVSDEILRRLVHLVWYRAEHSGRGGGYCYPKLATIGAWCQRGIRTVERHLAELVDLGLLVVKQRTKAGGEHTSNLYSLGKTFLASLFARKNKKSPMIRPTTKMSSNDLKREYKADANSEQASKLRELLEKHRLHLSEPLGAAPKEEAAGGWEKGELETPHAALVKAQARRILGR